MKSKNIWIWMILAFIGCYGCSDINSLHDQYLQRGEAIYAGQPDSVKIYTGKSRVILSYRIYDPKVAKLTVYWDFRQDSISFDVAAGKLGEETEQIIPDLKEKQYTFELVTSNREGKFRSIPLNISGTVYGSNYEASLTNRKISSATIFPLANYKMDIAWTSVLDNMAGLELLYRTVSDEEKVIRLINGESEIMITDSKDDNILYRTLYVLENCVDTFYTAYSSISFSIIESQLLDKNLYKRWNEGGIPYTSLGGTWGDIENLWDWNYNGNGEPPGFMSPGGLSITEDTPYEFTFQIGQLAMITEFIIWPRFAGRYQNSHPKRFEVWGSPTPDVTADLSTWIFLGECNSFKPSGLPGIQYSDALGDGEYVLRGEKYSLTANPTVPVRYLRFRILDTWNAPTPGPSVCAMELEFSGVAQEYLGL